MSKQILLINDLPGYGKVALSGMIPVLTHLKHNLYNLPTALVSNTLDYGEFEILDTTEYMINSIKVWNDLNFKFDAIATGFIVSDRQTEIIYDFCNKEAKKGTTIFVDPIMGDEGKLYNGIEKETIERMRKLISIADYIIPNYTEACYITDTTYEKNISKEQAYKLIEDLKEIGAKSIIITSSKVENKDTVIVYDHNTNETSFIDFKAVPVRFPGTGDIFSAILIGKILNGENLLKSTQDSMNSVKQMIEQNIQSKDKYNGIPVESCLDLI